MLSSEFFPFQTIPEITAIWMHQHFARMGKNWTFALCNYSTFFPHFFLTQHTVYDNYSASRGEREQGEIFAGHINRDRKG